MCEDFKIFALSETWLNSSIPSELFDIPGYCPLYRGDRLNGRRAGGVGFFVSSDFAPKDRRDLETPDFELLCVEIKINPINILCAISYRPPGLSTDRNVPFLDNLQMSLDKILSKPDYLEILMVIMTLLLLLPVVTLAVHCVVGWNVTIYFQRSVNRLASHLQVPLCLIL